MLVEELEARTSIIHSFDPMIKEIQEAQQLEAVCRKTDAHTVVHFY